MTYAIVTALAPLLLYVWGWMAGFTWGRFVEPHFAGLEHLSPRQVREAEEARAIMAVLCAVAWPLVMASFACWAFGARAVDGGASRGRPEDLPRARVVPPRVMRDPAAGTRKDVS